mmetsp:Transcript_17704/g.41051  ORF Transcript_17704/g.41051 Transcript_17704/m.41051 type:complete len:578 (+) Transcript_17704:40-1773(+)
MATQSVLRVCVWSSILVVAASRLTHQEWVSEDGMLRYMANGEYCMAVRDNVDEATERTPVVLWHCQKAASDLWDTSGPLIRWRANSSLCLGLANGLLEESGPPLMLQQCESDLVAQWQVDGLRIRAANAPGYVIGVREGVADGATLVLQPCFISHFRWQVLDGKIRFEAARHLCLGLPTKRDKFLSDSRGGQDSFGLALMECTSDEIGEQAWSNETGLVCLAADPSQCLASDGSHRDGAEVSLQPSAPSVEVSGWEVHEGRLRSRKQPDYCLTVRESNAEAGSQVVQWMCDAPGPRVTMVTNYLHVSPDANEFAWMLDGDLIRSKMDPRYCATVREGLAGDGADVIMWHCGVGPEAKWKVDGRQIKSLLDPTLCMSVREGRAGDGADVILWKCKARRANQWSIQGQHVLFARSPQFALSIRAGQLMDGADVILWSARSAAFEWQIHRGRIRFQAESHLCVSVTKGRAGPGSNVQLGNCRREDGMLWDVDKGQVRLRSKPELCLAVRESKPMDNADVIVWPCAEAKDRWSFHNQDKRLRYHAVDHREYCMSVRDGQAVSGSRATVWSCDKRNRAAQEL